MGILDRIQPVNQIEHDPWHICIYSEPKAGKTVLACQFPGAFLINCDKTGHKSLRNHPETRNVPVFTPNTIAETYEIVREIRNGKIPNVQTVVLDTISEFNKNSLTEKLRTELAKPNTKRERFDYWMSDYKPNTEITRELILELRDLKVNTIILAHEQTRIDKDTEAKEIGPSLPPAALVSLEATQDLIGYLTVRVSNDGTTKRKLRVMRNSIIMAGTRFKVDKPEIEEPTAEKLLKLFTFEKETTNAS